MKNVLKFGLMALAACSILFTACKKDDKSASEIVQSGSWKLTGDEEKLTTETTWAVNPIEACTADDVTTYTATAYTTDEGATKCDPTDDQTTTGVYTVSSDGKTMTVDGIAFASSISESKIVLTATNILGFGQDIRITMEPK